MKKFFSFFAAMLVALTVNAKVWPITPTECHEGTRTDGYTLYVELARGAQNGDTIMLMEDGEYLENQSLPVNNNVVIMAAEGKKPVVVMNGYFQVKASLTVEGITFKCKEGGQGYCFYFYENTPKFLKMENCEFKDFTQYCVSSWEKYHIDSCIVEDCYFHDLAKAPFYFAPSSLPNDTNACDNLTVKNSTFANITLADVAVLDLRNNGNNDKATSKLRVDHCTFYNCKGYERMIMAYKSPDVLVSNCIMMNPLADAEEASIYATYLYGGDVKNCVWYQTKRVYTKKAGGAVDNLNVDPLFVDAANGNYTLGEGSPALTAGTDGKPVGDPRWVPSVEPEAKYYLKNNWDAASDWTWKEMTKIEDDNYQLKAVFGGTGVNVNTAESDEGSDWYPIENISTFDVNVEQTTLKAKDTVVFVYTPSEKSLAAIVVGPYVEPSGVEHTYTVAGSSAVAFGTAWDPTNTANDMAKQDDGSYKWEKANLELPAGTIEFKVCQDHAWTTCWPAQNYALNVSEAATYTLKITFNPANENVGAELIKTGSAEIDPAASAKGSWDGWAAELVFVLADNKETASGALNLEPGDYEFKVILNDGDWRSNGYSYHREFTGADNITGNGDNMVLKADIAGEYTLTWTFATNALNITFPVPSGIDNTNVAVKAQKVIINGQLFIIRDGQMFNAQGQLQ